MGKHTTYGGIDYGVNVVGRRPLSFMFCKKFIGKR